MIVFIGDFVKGSLSAKHSDVTGKIWTFDNSTPKTQLRLISGLQLPYRLEMTVQNGLCNREESAGAKSEIQDSTGTAVFVDGVR